MTDKEQIEEIVKNVLKERTDIIRIPDLAEPISEALYNAGYRKESETSKEILMEIKDRSVWFIDGKIQKDHFSEQLNELAKTYGVEIEE